MPPRRSKRWRDKFIEGRQADQAAFRKADPFIKARLIKLAAPRKPEPARPLVHQAPGIQSGSNSSALGAALVALTPNPQPLRMPPSAVVFLRMSDAGLVGAASVDSPVLSASHLAWIGTSL